MWRSFSLCILICKHFMIHKCKQLHILFFNRNSCSNKLLIHSIPDKTCGILKRFPDIIKSTKNYDENGGIKLKNKKQSVTKKLFMGTLLTGVVISSGVGVAQAETIPTETINQVEQTTKYPSKVMKTVRSSLGISKHSTELDSQINTLTKIQVMDIYLESFGKKLKGNEVRKAVNDVFNIDLDVVSKNNYGSKLNSYNAPIMEALRVSFNQAPNSTLLDKRIMDLPKVEVMDRYIKEKGYALTFNENRELINNIFGVNLTGISGLENGQLSIYSKGQWVIQSNKDLFKISSSLDDVTLYVESTDYYKAQTGSSELPASLLATLINKGFTYDEIAGNYTYTNPTGESVPDADKTQIIGAIMGAIQQVNAK